MVSTLGATNLDSPITPANGKQIHCHDMESLYTTPEDGLMETEQPLKDSVVKKKGSRTVSKRKLFLNSGTPAKVKKLPSPSLKSSKKTTPSPVAASPISKDAPWPSYPLTERQQLQYLLEVTAKDAQPKDQQETDSDEGQGQGQAFTKLKKKDITKKESNTVRINKRNERGETLLHVAAIKGDVDDTIDLIKAGIVVNAKDYAGWTPLHEACNFGHLQIVEELIKGGGNVNSPGYEDISPLHDAVINNHVQVVELLLKYGADPEQRTMQGFTAIDLARSATILEILQSVKPLQKSIPSIIKREPNAVYLESNLDNETNGYSSHTSSEESYFRPSQTIDPVYQDTSSTSVIKDLPRQNSPYSRRSSSSTSLHSEIDDNIDPARLNECLDKAMVQMSSYLDPKKDCFDYDNEFPTSKYNSQVTAMPVSKSKSDDETLVKTNLQVSSNGSASSCINGLGLSQLKNDKSTAQKETIVQDSQFNKENQPVSKSLSCHSKTLTQSTQAKSDSSKAISESYAKSCQECVGHIKNPTWRKALAKQYHNPANLPLYVPGYHKFTMKSRNYTTHSQINIPEKNSDGSLKGNNELSRLKMQHKIEQEKLKLCFEQEVVRLFGRFARSAVKKEVPISACTILKHQMLSHGRAVQNSKPSIPTNEITCQSMKAEVEELLQKFEKRKVELLTRQKHEFDAVIALQKLGLDPQCQDQLIDIDDYKLEDFDVTPSGFKASYEQFFSRIDH